MSEGLSYTEFTLDDLEKTLKDVSSYKGETEVEGSDDIICKPMEDGTYLTSIGGMTVIHNKEFGDKLQDAILVQAAKLIEYNW